MLQRGAATTQQATKKSQAQLKFERDFEAWISTEGVEQEKRQLGETAVLFGSVPHDISGSWLRNGPGRFSLNGHQIKPLDGDGFIYKIDISHGKLFTTSKFVETVGYTKEQQTGKIHIRGAFGTTKARESETLIERMFGQGVGIPKLKNTANTALLEAGDKVLALWEGGLPYVLDRHTLQTVSKESTLNNGLKHGDMFGAHPKIDTFNGNRTFFNTGTNIEERMRNYPFKHYLKIWEFSTVELQQESLRMMPLMRPYAVFHELGLTQNYLVVPQCPIKMNILNMMLGGSLDDSWTDSGEELLFYITPKRSEGRKAPRIAFKAPHAHIFHMVNCFEKGDTVIADCVTYEAMPSLAAVISTEYFEVASQSTQAKFVRYKFNVRGWDGENQVVEEIVSPKCVLGTFHENDLRGVEFPVINPEYQGREYKFAYFVEMTWKSIEDRSTAFKRIIKVAVKTKEQTFWAPPNGQDLFLHEPCFTLKENARHEDDGYLLFTAFDGESQTSFFFIVDAQTLETLCQIKLDTVVPVGIHTSFILEKETRAKL